AERHNPQADVFHSGAVFEFLVAAKMGLLARTDPAVIAPDLPQALEIAGARIPLYDEEGRWYVWGFSLGVIGYNELRLEQLGLPGPCYRGQSVFDMPQQSSSVFTTQVAHFQLFGAEGVRELWDAFGRSRASNHPSPDALYSLVARGELPISFGTARNFYVNRA